MSAPAVREKEPSGRLLIAQQIDPTCWDEHAETVKRLPWVQSRREASLEAADRVLSSETWVAYLAFRIEEDEWEGRRARAVGVLLGWEIRGSMDVCPKCAEILTRSSVDNTGRRV